MKKDTSELLEALRGFADFRSFYNENAWEMQSISLCAALSALLEQKGLEKAQVVKKTQMSEVYAYQIFSGVRVHPARNKVLAVAIAMALTAEETQTLLKQTGYPTLYAKDPFDCVVLYGILHGMDVPAVNDLLYEYTGETLG